MNKIFFVTFVCLFVSSCKMERWCNEHYPPLTSDSTWASSKIDTVRDTIYFNETELFFDTTGVINTSVNFESVKKKNNVTLTVKAQSGQLKVDCRADSLEKVVEHYKYLDSVYNQRKEVKQLPCYKDHRTNWDVFCRWWSWISLFLLGASIYWIVKK